MKLNKKLSLILSVSIILILSFSVITIAETDLTIFHTNVHGRVKVDAEIMGMPYLASVVNDYRSRGDVLLLDAGDFLHGRPLVSKLEGESAIELMNYLGYEAMAPGNHDFNYGYQKTLELNEMMDGSIIATNVTKDGELLFDPYLIKEVDGKKIGIFGLATSDTYTSTHPDNVKGLEFLDMIESSREYVDILQNQEEVDFVIGLTHVGINNSTEIAESVEGIDLIIDGHSHTLLKEGKRVGSTLIVMANEYTKYLGKVEVDFQNGEINLKASLLSAADVKENYEPDPEVETMLGEYEDQLVEIMLGN